MKYPSLNCFNPVSIHDRDIVNSFTEKYGPQSCEYSFGGLYAWSEIYGIKICIYDDKLFIHDSSEDTLYVPLGDDVSSDYIKGLSKHYMSAGGSGCVAFIRPETLHEYRDAGFSIFSMEDESEYIYSLEALASLKGGSFLKQRNLISWFRRHFPAYRFLTLEKSMVSECLGLLARWAAQKKDTDFEAMDEEKLVIEKVFASFDEAGFEGFVIEIDGKISAFTVFSRLSEDCIVMHFTKFDREIRGLFQTLFIEAANCLKQRYKYLNNEQDMGLPGLKYLKQSYRPEMIYPCCCLMPQALINQNPQ
ncbi:MAG: hypothetical protein A2017_05800 [Lentisphaerae bacterium GWF2_44_16]|nr:MAG: hypothetical protein A2017_05800 [Lentisphaerae bacterium GWF2_44_16]